MSASCAGLSRSACTSEKAPTEKAGRAKHGLDQAVNHAHLPDNLNRRLSFGRSVARFPSVRAWKRLCYYDSHIDCQLTPKTVQRSLQTDTECLLLHLDHQMTCLLTLQKSKYNYKANLSFYAEFNCRSIQWKIKR